MTIISKAFVHNTHIEYIYKGTDLMMEDWTPASLFAVPYTYGAWYDFTDKSTMFQTATQNNPVTSNGQNISAIRDKSGTSKALVNTILGNTPTYNSADKGSAYFNGTTSFLYCFDTNINDFFDLTVAYSVKTVDASSTANGTSIFSTGANSGWANAPSIGSSNNFSQSDGDIRYATYLMFTRSASNIFAVGSSSYYRAANTWENIIASTGFNGSSLHRNGLNITLPLGKNATSTMNIAPASQPASQNGIYRVGQTVTPVTGNSYLKGNLSTIVILNRALTNIERSKLNAYLNSTR